MTRYTTTWWRVVWRGVAHFVMNRRMVRRGVLDVGEPLVGPLVVAYGGVDKIDKLVLPFPYAQLLKILMFLFVFSLPLVLVDELGWTTPPVVMVVALAFYGLDSVGTRPIDPTHAAWSVGPPPCPRR